MVYIKYKSVRTASIERKLSIMVEYSHGSSILVSTFPAKLKFL